MDKKLTNQDRFNILRGYYQGEKFHPMGGKGISLDDLLHQLKLANLNDFLVWYKSLTSNEIKNGKKEWCPGNCCQSILLRLLKLEGVKNE